MSRLVEKGIQNIRIFPILKRGGASQAPVYDQYIEVPGIQELTAEKQYNEEEIAEDNQVFEEKTHTHNSVSLTLGRLNLALQRHFEGGTYHEASKSYTWGSNQQAKEFGLTYLQQLNDGTYMANRVYIVKCDEISDANTTGEAKTFEINGSSYRMEINSRMISRKIITNTNDPFATTFELSSQAELEKFVVAGEEVVVPTEGSVITLPIGISEGKVELQVSPLATVNPSNGTWVDFSNPVTFTIVAEDGTVEEYTVTKA